MHVSHRLLKRQTQTGVLLRAVVAWKHAAAKVATTLTLCDSIARVAAQRRALGKLVRLFVTVPKLLVRRVSSLRRRALVFRVLKGWRKIYWSNVAERQLVKMIRRERLGSSIEAWKQAFNQRRRTRGLRMRVFRRELTPLFKAWHVKVSFIQNVIVVARRGMGMVPTLSPSQGSPIHTFIFIRQSIS
jgi:hypothetical protein